MSEAHLFFAVSTDLMSSAPFVPGSFTYSNFGAGACPWVGFVSAFTLSASKARGLGESSRLEVNALLIMRGMNRERDCGLGVLDGVGSTEDVVVIWDVVAGDVDGRDDTGGLMVVADEDGCTRPE